ncbi:ATP-binding cassette domain-containing protein [Paenalkalicoccus suaedae]|uniref:ATP-binding cassette domain-containing protein n=1 Tax=Paenalkalicoccus suaedae TaxID=2592382 RepID=A0A859FFG6_9BACI|nr:ATP-binding cassette domain-containing protein [Paenalkalicoccus suaedae]QKS71590.1 ATP-binding cassette domain-containing protein [Paenalkalicoccus suaedae]
MSFIEWNHVTKRIRLEEGLHTFFHEANMSIEEGTISYVKSESEDAISLFFAMMAATTPPNSGDIIIDGTDITAVQDRFAWRKRTIGYLNDDGLLVPDRSIRQNLLLGFDPGTNEYDVRNAQIEQLAEELGLSAEELDESIEGLDSHYQLLANLTFILISKPPILLATHIKEQTIMTLLLDYAKKHRLTVLYADAPYAESEAQQYITLSDGLIHVE